jgi:hypothetical protein
MWLEGEQTVKYTKYYHFLLLIGWFRHCATSRNVADSISDVVIAIFD